MKRTTLLLALTLTACGAAPDMAGPVAVPPDAGGTDSAPRQETGNDTGTDSPTLDGGSDSWGGEASTDAGADTAPIRPEASPEAGGELAPEGGPDGSTGPGSDGGRPVVDAAPEAAATVCDGQAPSAPLDCTAATPTCESVRRHNEAIREAFPGSCACGAMKCAGLAFGGVTETVPITCRNEAWTLAGMQSGTSWAPWFQCSKGCALGKICDP
jgi:predicted small lipoprotein YifL